ncbi:MAG: vanadium-dependent haloperoxidase [Phycisphaerales bacterium]
MTTRIVNPVAHTVVLFLALSSGAHAGDAVTRWNQTMMEAVRIHGGAPGQTSRAYGMMSAAVYDAVNAIDQSHTVFKVDARSLASSSDSMQAAASEAAYRVLSHLFPSQQALFDAQHAHELSLLSSQSSQQVNNGLAIGQLVASQLISLRANDGSAIAEVPNYTGSNTPGQWRPTGPAFAPGLGVNWGQVTPWTLTSGAQFRPEAPPALASTEYREAFQEVKDYGRRTDSLRTQDQTDAAIFWANDRNGTYKPMGQYCDAVRVVCEQEALTLVQNARLFALTNVAQADAGIAAWDAKYFYDLWRPISAITDPTGDGDPLTIEEPGWMPLADLLAAPMTPAFPSYVSGHATFGAAAMWMGALVMGDDHTFTLATDEPIDPRSFTSFSQAIQENSDSRVWLGVHWRFDQTIGERMGKQIAEYIHANYFLPVPAPAAAALFTLAGLIPSRRRR